jgi:hypothetical protein
MLTYATYAGGASAEGYAGEKLERGPYSKGCRFSSQFTCFTGTKVLSLFPLLLQKYYMPAPASSCRFSVYLLYWYKSTNTDAEEGAVAALPQAPPPEFSVYLLYWYKSTNTDAEGAVAALPQAPPPPEFEHSEGELMAALHPGGGGSRPGSPTTSRQTLTYADVH